MFENKGNIKEEYIEVTESLNEFIIRQWEDINQIKRTACRI